MRTYTGLNVVIFRIAVVVTVASIEQGMILQVGIINYYLLSNKEYIIMIFISNDFSPLQLLAALFVGRAYPSLKLCNQFKGKRYPSSSSISAAWRLRITTVFTDFWITPIASSLLVEIILAVCKYLSEFEGSGLKQGIILPHTSQHISGILPRKWDNFKIEVLKN